MLMPVMGNCCARWRAESDLQAELRLEADIVRNVLAAQAVPRAPTSGCAPSGGRDAVLAQPSAGAGAAAISR
jgi:hypothetical protein